MASRISESINPNNPSDLPETLLDDIYNLLYNEQSAPTMWSIPEGKGTRFHSVEMDAENSRGVLEMPQSEEMMTEEINYSASPVSDIETMM